MGRLRRDEVAGLHVYLRDRTGKRSAQFGVRQRGLSGGECGFRLPHGSLRHNDIFRARPGLRQGKLRLRRGELRLCHTHARSSGLALGGECARDCGEAGFSSGNLLLDDGDLLAVILRLLVIVSVFGPLPLRFELPLFGLRRFELCPCGSDLRIAPGDSPLVPQRDGPRHAALGGGNLRFGSGDNFCARPGLRQGQLRLRRRQGRFRLANGSLRVRRLETRQHIPGMHARSRLYQHPDDPAGDGEPHFRPPFRLDHGFGEDRGLGLGNRGLGIFDLLICRFVDLHFALCRHPPHGPIRHSIQFDVDRVDDVAQVVLPLAVDAGDAPGEDRVGPGVEGDVDGLAFDHARDVEFGQVFHANVQCVERRQGDEGAAGRGDIARADGDVTHDGVEGSCQRPVGQQAAGGG